MSLLKTIDQHPSTLANESLPDPDRLISGSPEFKTWPLDSARDGQVKTGVWQATPGVTRSVKGEMFEFCYILEGVPQSLPGVNGRNSGKGFRHRQVLQLCSAQDAG